MPPYTMAFISGLFKERTIKEDPLCPIPLQYVSVSVKVVDFVAEVILEQQYRNDEETPIEAIYIFPLDHDSAVHTFEADIDGRQLVGVIKEKEAAMKEYEEALKHGQVAAILQQIKTEIFKARIGNIPPGKQASVKIAYYTELLPEDSAVRFYLPTTIAPRYCPASDNSKAAKAIANIKYTDFSPAPLKVAMKFEMKSRITRIESLSHEIKYTIEDTENAHKMFEATASLAAETTDMDKDFVVLISTENPHTPRICLENDSEQATTAAVLTVVPKFELDDQKAEVIFIIDCSASMSGLSINKAKEALKLFLHSLPVDCYVNIVKFGSKHQALFENESKKYDDAILKKCILHASNLNADLGGTEILQPLQEVFTWKPIEGYIRQVFVLTDGAVSNTKEVIKCVQQNAHMARVFSLGIGSCASHELVAGISRAGHGTCEYVSYGENYNEKVIKQLKHALQPSLTNVSVRWENVEVEPSVLEKVEDKLLLEHTIHNAETPKNFKQAPYEIPPVFSGNRTLVYCIFEKENVPKQVTLTAETPNGPLNYTWNVNDAEIYEGRIVHRLAARKLIRDLEDGISWLQSFPADKIKKEVINLGCKYGITSSYTSFVAVDKQTDTVAGNEFQIVIREIPNQFPHGWRSGSSRIMRGPPMHSVGAPVGSKLLHGASDPMSNIIDLQESGGQFIMDASLPSLFGSTNEAVTEGAVMNNVSETVWATVIAIAILEERFADRKDEWELVAVKAMKWIKNADKAYDNLLQKAREFVKKCNI